MVHGPSHSLYPACAASVRAGLLPVSLLFVFEFVSLLLGSCVLVCSVVPCLRCCAIIVTPFRHLGCSYLAQVHPFDGLHWDQSFTAAKAAKQRSLQLASAAQAQAAAAAASGASTDLVTSNGSRPAPDPYRIVKPPMLGLPPPTTQFSTVGRGRVGEDAFSYSGGGGGGGGGLGGGGSVVGLHRLEDQDHDVVGGGVGPHGHLGRGPVPALGRPPLPLASSRAGSVVGGGVSEGPLLGPQLSERLGMLVPGGGGPLDRPLGGGGGGGSVTGSPGHSYRGLGHTGPGYGSLGGGRWPAPAKGRSYNLGWHEADESSTQCGSVSSLYSTNTFGLKRRDADAEYSDPELDGVDEDSVVDSEGESGGAVARAALRRDPVPGRSRLPTVRLTGGGSMGSPISSSSSRSSRGSRRASMDGVLLGSRPVPTPVRGLRG